MIEIQNESNLIRAMNNFGPENHLLLEKLLGGALAFAYLLLFPTGIGHAEGRNPIDQMGECTIAIFSGTITSDGRPIIWKNRDVGNQDQRYIYCGPYQRDGIMTHKFIGNCYRGDTTRIYMGANERGFAIMNSDSYNMHDSLYSGMDDGTLMRIALETCSSLADFESLLDSTNITRRLDCWNFGCLDSSGNCAMYECGNRSYVKFDPLDPGLNSPGFVARSNFSLSGDTVNQSGLDRYLRANLLIQNRLQSGAIDVGWVLANLARDLANVYADPYPLPYDGMQFNGPQGYIFAFGCTIANRYTASAVAIRGVNAWESPALTTTFAILGTPVLSVAYPLWVGSGSVPVYLSEPAGAPMYTYCRQRVNRLYDNPSAYLYLNSRVLVDDDSNGIYSYTFPLETWGINQADNLLDNWGNNPPDQSGMIAAQSGIARVIFSGFQRESSQFMGDTLETGPTLPRSISIYNYPNPFNSGTRIVYSGASEDFPVILRIYDIAGRQITKLQGTGPTVGDVYWTGRDTFGEMVSTGIYFCSLENGPLKSTGKMLLIK